ncbi:hypothetical protein ACQKOM_10605 [Peribacillus frigoritolerans]|uniref:hypothetical protein n=1 Tax=Peribacillus frigoritolerans TaxID=450367 RepID=UPI003CFE0ACD
MIERKKNGRGWIITLGLLTIVSILGAIVYIKSLNYVQSNHWFLVVSTILIIFGLLISSILNYFSVEENNHYYQFVFTIFATFIGFTISTAGQETLKNKDDRETIGSVLEMSREQYSNHINNKLDKVIHKEKYDFSGMAFLENEMVNATIPSRRIQNEPLMKMIENQPFMLKAISNDLKRYFSTYGSISTYYADFDDRLQYVYFEKRQTRDNIYLLYLDFGRIYTELTLRKELLELELKLLNGEMSKEKHKMEFKKIEEDRLKELEEEIQKKAEKESSFYPSTLGE